MQKRTVFNDGKTQTSPAALFGVTLIHTVKAFKDSLVMFFRNADSRIRYSHFRAIECITYPDRYPSILVVVLHGIFTDIVDHLIEYLTDTEIFHRFSCHFHSDILLGCLR